MQPKQTDCGKWRVGDRLFETNAQAWRYIDRLENEPVSRSEDLGDWIFRKMTNGAR